MNYFDPNTSLEDKSSKTKMRIATGFGVLSLVSGFAILGWTLMRNASCSPTVHSTVEAPTAVLNGVELIETYKSTEGSFFGLDEDNNGVLDGIDILKEMIDTRLHDGPEFGSLSKIVFSNSDIHNIITNDVEGCYYPETRELFINTKYTNQNYPIVANRSNSQNYLIERMEMMFQTFFHEYGHHIANMTYLSNYDVAPASTERIYYNGREEQWAENFVMDFKHALNYDKSTPLYSGDGDFLRSKSSNEDYRYKNGGEYNNYRMKSIGSIYNAADLFAESNKFGTPNFSKALPDNLGKFVYTFSGTGFDWIGTPLGPDSVSNIPYYFSMQELFTRKYMQLLYQYKTPTTKINSDGSFVSTGSQRGAVGSSILYDALKYQNGVKTLRNNTSDRFLHDAPFEQQKYLGKEGIANAADILFDAFTKVNGSHSLSNISLLWHKNSSTMSSSSRRMSATSPLSEVNNIKFGGYYVIDPSDPLANEYSYVGYLDNNGEFVALPITSRDFTLGRNSSVAASSWEESTIIKAKSYYLTNFVNYSTIKGRDLFFSNNEDGSDKVPLTSIKNNPGYGNSSSFKSSSPSEFNRNFTYAKAIEVLDETNNVINVRIS